MSSKYFLVPAAIVAAAAAISKVSSKRKEQKRQELVENRNQNIDSLRADVAALSNGNTMMGMQPVAGDHAARVLSGRNGASAGVDTSNPAVSAIPYEVVRT